MKKELNLIMAENLLSTEKGLVGILNEFTNFKCSEAVQNLVAGVSVNQLMSLTISEIIDFGFNRSNSKKILIAIELALKLNSLTVPKSFVIRSPEDAFKAVAYLQYENQEKFVVLALDTKNNIIARQEVFKGSLNAAIVHPREVFSFALKHNAASIVVAHNHPSTDPLPSRQDIEVTSRLKGVGKIVGIELLDHIIVGGTRFISLKEKGYV
jgi:DNA repair protein RadC